MASLTDAVMDPIEDGFDKLGMMQGEAAPLKRAAVGGVLGYAIAYGIKPSFAFDSKGDPKPFGTKKGETLFPAWGIVVLPAIIFGVLI
jgi:hypothetical protein